MSGSLVMTIIVEDTKNLRKFRKFFEKNIFFYFLKDLHFFTRVQKALCMFVARVTIEQNKTRLKIASDLGKSQSENSYMHLIISIENLARFKWYTLTFYCLPFVFWAVWNLNSKGDIP